MDINALAASIGSGAQQAYTLEVKSAGPLAQAFSVIRFDGQEALGEPSRFVIRLTHPQADLPRTELLGAHAVFSINPPALPGLPTLGTSRKTQGIITGFNQLACNAELSTYEVVLESRLAQLRNVTRCRVFMDQSVPEIIDSILREYPYVSEHSHFSFKLHRQYEERPLVMQWQESDLAFIQRLCRRSGIWFRIDAGEWEEVIHFGDDFTCYRQQPPLLAPFAAQAGLESVGAEAVQSLETHTKSVAQSVLVRDYNRLTAPHPIEQELNLAYQDKTTFGQATTWGSAHLDKEQAEWEARLRHEAALSEQVVYHGSSNVLGLIPGAVFRLSNKVLPDAEYGQLITSIHHHGARDVAYHNRYTAIPSDRIYRLPLKEADWPRIAGTVSARIASPDRYPYAYLNQDGDYRVQFDFDLDPHKPGRGSCWMRLAKPFAGSQQTGFHFPLIDGTEVAVAFHDGDPDRPYIAHALHDSRNGDLITNQDRWMSRNEIRTQSNNKLRMEDWQDQQHVKLATEHGKSQLNLGHLVDAQKQQRGEGVELRTDGWGSIRAGKGVLLSSHVQDKAQGQQLDIQEALQQLQNAKQMVDGLTKAAQIAQAEIADARAMQQVMDDQIKELREAVMLLSAASSIVAVSPASIQHSAGRNLAMTSGANTEIGALKKFIVTAGETVSIFAHQLGMKLFANKGKVQIQAQNDELELLSQQNMTISSSDGDLLLQAKKSLTLSDGQGGYIKLANGNITIGSPGLVSIKMDKFQWDGPDSQIGKFAGFSACTSDFSTDSSSAGGGGAVQ